MTEQTSRRIMHVVVNPTSQDPNGRELRTMERKLTAIIEQSNQAGIKQHVQLLTVDEQFDWGDDVHNVVVIADGEPLGIAQFAKVEYTVSSAHDDEEEDKHFILLHTLYVVPAVRRQGVGRMLMNAVSACTEDASHIEIDVDPSNTGARQFYARIGFIAESMRLTRRSGAETTECAELDAECDEQLAPPVFTYGVPTDAEIIKMHAFHLQEVPFSVIEIIRPGHAKEYDSFVLRVEGEVAAIIQTVSTPSHPRELRRIYSLPKFREAGVEIALCQYFSVQPTLQALTMMFRA